MASKRAHEIRWQFIDLGTGAALVAFLWLTFGQIAGIAFAIVWSLLMLLGVFVLLARRRLAQRDRVGAGSDPPQGT